MAIFPNIKWWHYTENDIFYFQSSWKDGLSKNNCAGIWPFLYYLERSYFFFPKIWSYTIGRKWKMILLKTIHGNMIFSSGPLKWWSLQKGRHMVFLVLCRKMVFFPKTWYFSLGRKRGVAPPWKYMEIYIFCVHVLVLQTWRHAPMSKKIKDGLIPQKYT